MDWSKLSEEDRKRIEKVRGTGLDIYGSVYRDFFGTGAGSGHTDGGADSAGGVKDPVKNAQDALKEARDVFGDELVKAQQQKEEAGEPEKPAEDERDPEEELNELIGLTKIKHDMKELADFASVQKMRKDQGLKYVPVSLHMVFTGNPGTGKTTVARILSRMYKKIGILTGGQLVETDRSGLVAGYVGQTAIKTQEQIKKAEGGVLFIDEAYALAQRDDPFGQEAIDTLLKAMEDKRDNLIVIVAGYTKPMEKFINSNPGLKSRFNRYIEFPDYTVDELMQIFYLDCRKYEYVLDEDVRKHVREMVSLRKMQRTENFANGREVRNIFEDIVTNQARRIARMENPTHDDLVTITLDDLTDEEESGKKTDTAADKKADSAADAAPVSAADKASDTAADKTPVSGADTAAGSAAESSSVSEADAAPEQNPAPSSAAASEQNPASAQAPAEK